MKTPKQLTPKPVQKSTPNSQGKIKKANKKNSPNSLEKATPNSVGKIKAQQGSVQKTLKLGKTPQTNGQTPGKKGMKTPKLKKALISDEDTETPKAPAIANNTQKVAASVKKQKKSLGKPGLTPQPSKAQKRKQPSDAEDTEATPPKQAKTSPGLKEGKTNRRVRSEAKRLEVRQQKKERHQQLMSKLKKGDETVLESAEIFKAKLTKLQSRPKLSKSGLRTVRRYKRYLNMINSIQTGDKSNLNKSALEHLKSIKKTKSKQKPNNKPSTNAKNKTDSAKKCEVFVKNLPYEIQTEEIAEHFKQVGEVVNVSVPGGKAKKGSAYVQFENEEICQKALDLHQTVLNGRKINVFNKDRPAGTKKSPKKT